MKIIIIILILLFSVIDTAADLFNQDKSISSIIKSIKDHPEQWLDTGTKFIHCDVLIK